MNHPQVQAMCELIADDDAKQNVCNIILFLWCATKIETINYDAHVLVIAKKNLRNHFIDANALDNKLSGGLGRVLCLWQRSNFFNCVSLCDERNKKKSSQKDNAISSQNERVTVVVVETRSNEIDNFFVSILRWTLAYKPLIIVITHIFFAV